MIKYAIKLHENHKQGRLIFHAVPTDDLDEMIKLNSPFDELSIYDKEGNIVEMKKER